MFPNMLACQMMTVILSSTFLIYVAVGWSVGVHRSQTFSQNWNLMVGRNRANIVLLGCKMIQGCNAFLTDWLHVQNVTLPTVLRSWEINHKGSYIFTSQKWQSINNKAFLSFSFFARNIWWARVSPQAPLWAVLTKVQCFLKLTPMNNSHVTP